MVGNLKFSLIKEVMEKDKRMIMRDNIVHSKYWSEKGKRSLWSIFFKFPNAQHNFHLKYFEVFIIIKYLIFRVFVCFCWKSLLKGKGKDKFFIAKFLLGIDPKKGLE